ncbi:HINT3 [Bugula neritina]|uniref:Adenosine 5'-monophosphoramidase HINT3 n=1 Tax=Bugula neritina TaxID=10212 RepID=A0A7J7J1H3_BUGNE|nr:HINT3 [Bugula neritina]
MANSKKCVFCDIVNKVLVNGKETEILYEDETVVAFKDIKPATRHHYLVVPKEHLESPKTLTKDNLGLLNHMLEVGENVLVQQGFQSDNNKRFGYHWPPFNSISHLHMHALGNTEELGFFHKGMFMTGTPWFVSHQWLMTYIKQK